MKGIYFVEQPLHRDYALNDTVAHEMNNWDECPAMIIDESDGELMLNRALELGYRGTSHKNLRVFKGIANSCKIQFNRENKEENG